MFLVEPLINEYNYLHYVTFQLLISTQPMLTAVVSWHFEKNSIGRVSALTSQFLYFPVYLTSILGDVSLNAHLLVSKSEWTGVVMLAHSSLACVLEWWIWNGSGAPRWWASSSGSCSSETAIVPLAQLRDQTFNRHGKSASNLIQLKEDQRTWSPHVYRYDPDQPQ